MQLSIAAAAPDAAAAAVCSTLPVKSDTTREIIIIAPHMQFIIFITDKIYAKKHRFMLCRQIYYFLSKTVTKRLNLGYFCG
jgi:hypothetical protein